MNLDEEGGRPPRLAVIGGGITGLAAAHRLLELTQRDRRPAEVTLFEAADRLGGVFGTRRLGEFVIETGADSFVTDKPWCIDLCRRLGLEPRLITVEPRYRRALILHRGRTVPVPEGLNLLAPGSLRGLMNTPLLTLRGKLRAALESFVPRSAAAEDESLASFVRRRFGPEFLERIAQPVVGGIYTADPEKLSLAATLPRFLELEREHGSLIRAARRVCAERGASENASGARYGLFAGFVDGMSELPDALAAQVRAAARVELRQSVLGLTTRPDTSPSGVGGCGWQLHLSEGRRESFEAVVLALPAYAAATLLADSAPQLSRALQEIEYASSAIVVTGHRLADVGHPLDAAGLVIPHVEARRVLAISFLSRKFPSRAPAGFAILRTFVGGALQPQLLDRSDEDLIALVRGELAEILAVRGNPQFAVVLRYPRGMPQYHVGHLDRVARIEQLAAGIPSLALAGNAYRGVGLPDCIHSGESAAERIWDAVAGNT